jgi:hypothetical protein
LGGISWCGSPAQADESGAIAAGGSDSPCFEPILKTVLRCAKPIPVINMEDLARYTFKLSCCVIPFIYYRKVLPNSSKSKAAMFSKRTTVLFSCNLIFKFYVSEVFLKKAAARKLNVFGISTLSTANARDYRDL